MTTYNVALTEEEVRIVLAGLWELPAKVSVKTIQALEAQIKKQQDKAAKHGKKDKQ